MNLVSKFMNQTVTVGGMTGTRVEYLEYLIEFCGWTRRQAVEIASSTKGK